VRQAAPVIRLAERRPTPAEIRFRKVEARGEFLAERVIYLDNKTRDGVAGYEVVMPLRVGTDGTYVLVNRGWVARGLERSQLPAVDTPAGPVTVIGTAGMPSERIYELSGPTIEGRIWQNLVLDRYRSVTGLRVVDFVIQQENEADDGLLRRWDVPGFGIERHRSYAYQWLIFASLIVIFWRVQQRRLKASR
jgi:surfeit locus 1 family protein